MFDSDEAGLVSFISPYNPNQIFSGDIIGLWFRVFKFWIANFARLATVNGPLVYLFVKSRVGLCGNDSFTRKIFIFGYFKYIAFFFRLAALQS